MDWTKIMNKKWQKIRRKKSGAEKPKGKETEKETEKTESVWKEKKKKPEKEESQEEEQERIRQKLRLHVKELTEEMNLRLVLDLQSEMENGNLPEEMWLWVDSISVVYMEFPQKRKKPFFLPFLKIGSMVRKAGKRCYNYFFGE